ncbi:hypothetical protein [Leptospira santarosai]|uniref:hypothetical protein n=1 Tax=Leptospira santarosai TaxID=28183 RepID=UPI000ABB7D24|nr:hypothetical protein [Leptospira santarosai]
MNNGKLSNDDELLTLLIKDSKAQVDDLYKPGPYWKNYATRIYQEIRRSGIDDFRNNVNIGKGYADIIHSNPFELIRDPGSFKEKMIRKFANLPIVNRYITSVLILWIKSFLTNMLYFRSKYYSVTYGSIMKNFTDRLGKIDYGIGNPKNVIDYKDDKIGKSYFDAVLRLSEFEKK